MLSVLEQMSSNSSSSGSGDPTTKQQHRYRLSVYDSASAAQFCANADAAASSPRPTLVVNLENTRFASSERTPVLYFAHIQRKRSRTTGAAAESGTHVDEASGELLLRRALVLERDLALHYFGRNGAHLWHYTVIIL